MYNKFITYPQYPHSHTHPYHHSPEQNIVGRHSLNISFKAKLTIFEMLYFITSVELAWKRSVAADLMVADYVFSHEFFGKVFLHFCQLWVWKLGLDTCFWDHFLLFIICKTSSDFRSNIKYLQKHFSDKSFQFFFFMKPCFIPPLESWRRNWKLSWWIRIR